MAQLMEFGGFPEPFLAGDRRFFNRWKKLRFEQLLREDVRDLSRINELGQMEQLALMLAERAGGIINYSNLAADINTSVDTVTRWMKVLESLYYCFRIHPFSTSIPKSLRKQPKVYLHDWSGITDIGARHENFVAVHLRKAVDLWTDAGYGEFGLFYLRDKAKREVNFLVTKERTPCFLVEVKSSADGGLTPAISYFKKATGAPHAFQIAFDLPYVERDCFAECGPIIVPALTLLSQLG
jgi:predicted AAA+ superfamily ATPase